MGTPNANETLVQGLLAGHFPVFEASKLVHDFQSIFMALNSDQHDEC